MVSFFTLIIFFRENKLFQRGWGVFVLLCGDSGGGGGGGGSSVPCKMENQGGGGGGVGCVTFGFNSKVNSREEGSWMIKITFQGVNFEHSMKIIATY